jgi:DNA-binding transcriptional ArsR family regulator
MMSSDVDTCTPEPEVAPPADADLEIALLAKALGNPVRVRILRLLLSRDACYCGQIVDELPLAQATVSQHLKILKDAGLVRGDIEGPRVCYCANRERLRQLGALVGVLADTQAPILEGVA